MWSAIEKDPGSVMRNVSKAKFDGSLLEFTLLERVEDPSMAIDGNFES